MQYLEKFIYFDDLQRRIKHIWSEDSETEYVYLYVHDMSKTAFGSFALSYENQSLLVPLVPLLACPVLLIFPHSIAHFHILQTCYPCLFEFNLHQFRNR